MKLKKRDKTVEKNLKGYSTLSILEKDVYSEQKHILKVNSRSVMEIAIYNPTVQNENAYGQKRKRKTESSFEKNIRYNF